jgi:hypothetical protein
MFRPYTHTIAFSIGIVCLYAIINARQKGMRVWLKHTIAFSIDIVCLYANLNARQEGMHVAAKHLSPVPAVIATGAVAAKRLSGERCFAHTHIPLRFLLTLFVCMQSSTQDRKV